MEDKIKLFNKIIKTHNQYERKSNLWFSIKEAYTLLKNPELLSDEEARKKAKEFCNDISLYATAFACGGIAVRFPEFIKTGIDNGRIRQRDGFIFNGEGNDKQALLSDFGFEIDMDYVEDWDDIENPDIMEEGFYQMKIRSRSGKHHFIGCYFYNDILYMSDTSNRGTGVKVKKKIKPSDFYWLLRIG
jgi:hypothetical protein